LDNRQLLENGMKEMGLNPTEAILNDFFEFKNLLVEWNEKINLTAITEDRDIVIKHFLDSLSCLKSGLDFSDKRVLDLGTGGGFPGVPLKIYDRSIQMTLLDSLNKRIKYLKLVGEALGFNHVEYLHSRAEDSAVKPEYRASYDIVVSRAVANMSTLSEYCLPYVKVGGYFVAQKTVDALDEIKSAERGIQLLGGSIESIVEGTVPYSELKHNLVLIKKEKETPKNYPRKAGMPSKNPLK
jgi:16S rRNA (guanine527-N7)-methyltransferase